MGFGDRLPAAERPLKTPKTPDFPETVVWWREVGGVGGGPGRTRTCNQTVMSAI